MAESMLGGRLIVKVGDITEEKVDAIVNAANPTLLGGGGVDGAVHRRGGPAILEQCRVIRRTRYPYGLPTGEAVITTGGDLPAAYVIHTVGPIYKDGESGEPKVLARAYSTCLAVADRMRLQTVAFPAISTGAYGYPPAAAAVIAINATVEVLRKASHVHEVRFVFFHESMYNVYVQVAGDLARETNSFTLHKIQGIVTDNA